MEQVLGETFRAFAIIMVCWGLPRQIIKQYKDNRFGMDFPFSIIVCIVYFFRAWYGVETRNWYIIIPDSIGFTLSVMVSYQRFNPKPWVLKMIANVW